MPRKKITATKLKVGLPFGIGELQFEPDEVQEQAAWALYVELVTRIAVQPLDPDHGTSHDALVSLYSLFGTTRKILREAGPRVATGKNSVGVIAIEVLNRGIRPFLAKWHPLLESYEQTKPTNVNQREHERAWEEDLVLRKNLAKLQEDLRLYAQALAEIARIK